MLQSDQFVTEEGIMLKVLAVDCDDVVCQFNQSFIAYHNRTFGTTVSYEDVFTHDMEVVWGCSKEEINRRVDDFYHSTEHERMLPIEGAPEALALLATIYRLELVTNRPVRRRSETEAWINTHCPDVFSGLHFTNGFGGASGDVRLTKSAVCHAIGAKLLIEDAPQHVAEVASTDIPVIVPDRPWNRIVLPSHALRTFTWTETAKIVRDYLR